jgi:uncharacterized protein YndB with AHSA1/START domain
MVTVDHERERGLRNVHQTRDGDFAASASRTCNLPMAKLYRAWTNQKVRRGWLLDAQIQIRVSIEMDVRGVRCILLGG